MKRNMRVITAAVLAGVTLSISACGSAKTPDSDRSSREESQLDEEDQEDRADEKASEEKEEKVTAESIAKKAMKEMEDVDSAKQEIHLLFDASVSQDGDATNINMDLGMNSEITKAPYMAHGKANLAVSVDGEKQAEKIELYKEVKDGSMDTYMSMDGSTWTKETKELSDGDDVLYDQEIYEGIADGSLKAELEEDTEKIDGEDAYVMTVDLDEDYLNDIMQDVSGAMGEMGSLSDISAKAKVLTYKESGMPAGIYFDAADMGQSMISAMLGSSEDMENVDFDVKEFKVSTGLSGFNEVDAITIPREAAEGSSSIGNQTDDSEGSHSAGPSEIPADAEWSDMVFSLDGEVHTIPFAYSDISDDWSFDMADYGYEDGYVLNPGQKVYSTIELENPAYTDGPTFMVGLMNNDSELKDIKDTDIWSISIDMTYADQYPEVELPGGITWGSTAEEIEAAYGEPSEDPYRSDELGYSSYTYKVGYNKKLRLQIFDDKGLTKIELQDYGNE